MGSTSQKFEGDRQEVSDFEILWALFQKEDSFPISLKQGIILLDNLHKLRQLTEPVAEDILRSIKVDQDILESLKKQEPQMVRPDHRIELWKAPDTTVLALVAWSPGKFTKIHDHSHFGLTRTLEGSVTSFGFKYLDESTLEYLGRIHFEKNRVYHVPTGNVFIHTVGNLHKELATELHFYGPKLEGKKSNCYHTLDDIDIINLDDGASIKVNCRVDPDQIENRFN